MLFRSKRLDLYQSDEALTLPPVPMPALNTLGIGGGNGEWDKDRIDDLLVWAQAFAPNLDSFAICNHDRATAQLFVEALSECAHHNKLENLLLIDCDLVEDDAERLLFGLQDEFPNLKTLSLCRNKIESIDSIGHAAGIAAKARKEGNNQVSTTLKRLNLSENPFFANLKDSKSSDHAAAMSLLDSFERLCWLGHSKETDTPTAELEYKTKLTLI